MAEVAATGAVEIVDFKGHYGLDTGDDGALLAMYERAIELFPDALLEDAHDLPEVAALLSEAGDRISYDAPIHSAADLDTVPLRPRAVNIKPCRVGDLRSLLEVYSVVAERGMIVYGGGMGELGVGRDQIQLLASLFHPDGPNDTAPSGYNADTPSASLPASPLPAAPAPVGFRRASEASRGRRLDVTSPRAGAQLARAGRSPRAANGPSCGCRGVHHLVERPGRGSWGQRPGQLLLAGRDRSLVPSGRHYVSGAPCRGDRASRSLLRRRFARLCCRPFRANARLFSLVALSLLPQTR